MSTTLTPLRRARTVGADRVAVVCSDTQLTYRDVWDRCARLVAGLRALGVSSNDRVAVVAANCHRYLELYQAVPAAGMVLVPLNHRHTHAELQYALEDSGTKVLFIDREPGPLSGC